MLEEIKKIQGINHNEFDTLINGFIRASSLDLKAIGIAEDLINKDDKLIHTAKLTYVLSFLDVQNAELWRNSYAMQKDALRHYSEYKESNQK